LLVEQISIEKLYVSDLNVRYDHEFGDEEDQELINNIESIGILQPIVVRPREDNYEIIIGRRRFLSMQKNGVKQVTCLVTDLNDDEALDASISENVFRKSVDPVTLGKWIRKRLEESNISLSEYARKIGKAKSTLSEWVRMNDLSQEIQEEVQGGSVPFNYALKVARMDLTEEQEKMLALEARNNGIDAFKKAVDRISSGKEKRGAPAGLLVIRINFGKESQEYDKLKELSEKKGMELSEYTMNILRDHVRSSNI
jgi:ParB/RepB/Spo0J family partition protein